MNKEMSKEGKEKLAGVIFEKIKEIIENAEKKLSLVYPIKATNIKTISLNENLTTFVFERQYWLRKCEIKKHGEIGRIEIYFKEAESLSADFESSGYEAVIMHNNKIIFHAKKDNDLWLLDKKSLKIILGEREKRIYRFILNKI